MSLQGIFISILNMSVTASYVAAGVIFVRIFFRKAPKIFSYVLWAVVLFRLICPVTCAAGFSFLGLLHVDSQNNRAVSDYVPHDIGFRQTPTIQSGPGVLDRTVNSSLPQAAPMASVNPMQAWMEVLSLIWIAGIVALLSYSVISYIKVKKQLRTATLVKDNIYQSDRIGTAFVCGFVRPKIYVPVAVGDADLSYVLEHERTHIRRKDYLIKPLAFFALILHWFNPLMWLSFALMNRDMEMSCDESVLQRMSREAKGGYAGSLLSLSAKRSGLLAANPLAFGESQIKSRIKNVLNYKKPPFWVIVLAAVAMGVLIAALATNPKPSHTGSNTYSGYSIEKLIANKTPYVGHNSKVVGLIDAMPLPEGIARGAVELQTVNPPYGIIINYIMRDSAGVMVNGAINTHVFFPNAIMLFSLIDNVDVIKCQITDQTGQDEGTSYYLTYTREMAEELLGGDVRIFAAGAGTLKNLIDRAANTKSGTGIVPPATASAQIEGYLKIIISSPQASSNPYDYINAHQNEYESILKMGDVALTCLLSEFEKGGHDDLKGYIMMASCKELLGARNNVTDGTLTPQEWYRALSIREEVRLPDFEYDGQDPIEKFVYDTEIEKHSGYQRGGFTVVAPKIFGSYEEGDLLKVFVTTYSASYKLYGNALAAEGGGVIPAAITYRKDNSGRYILERYEQAGDGSQFPTSIRKYCSMPASGRAIEGLADRILAHYADYEDIRILLYDNLTKHLRMNGVYNATLTNSLGEVEFRLGV